MVENILRIGENSAYQHLPAASNDRRLPYIVRLEIETDTKNAYTMNLDYVLNCKKIYHYLLFKFQASLHTQYCKRLERTWQSMNACSLEIREL